MPVQMVTIEGNIGSGKTSVARAITKYMPDTRFFAAPGRTKNPHWNAFHENPKGHALAMQSWFLRERLRVYVEALRHMAQARESVVLDFSIYSDEIFATAHFEHGYMTADEFAKYKELSASIFALKLPPPHLTIMLHAAPAVCLDRSAGLERPALDESYLHRLDELHRQRYVRDLERVFTPTWMQPMRVPRDAPGLAAAPSLLVLVRDWSDLSKVKPTAIGDAVMCTDPTDFDAWYAPFQAEGLDARVTALLHQSALAIC